MRAPPERRTVLAGTKGGSPKSDSCDGHISNQYYFHSVPFNQGNYSYELTAHPVALAYPFSFFHAVSAQ